MNQERGWISLNKMTEYQQIAYIISNNLPEIITIGTVGYLTLIAVSAHLTHREDLEEKSKKSLKDKL